MISLFRWLARLPLPLMHAVGGCLGWLVWWMAPDYRRRFRENAEAAGFTPAQYRPSDHRGRCHGGRASLAAGAARRTKACCRKSSGGMASRIRGRTGRAQGRDPGLAASRQLGDLRAGGRRTLFEAYGPITALFRPARKKFMAELMRRLPGPARSADLAAPPSAWRARADPHACATAATPACCLTRCRRWGRASGRRSSAGHGLHQMTLLPRLAQQTGARVFLGVCERLPRGAGYAHPVRGLRRHRA